MTVLITIAAVTVVYVVAAVAVAKMLRRVDQRDEQRADDTRRLIDEMRK